MLKIYILVILTILLFKIPLSAQSYQTQRKQVYVYNILLNGISAGLSGAVNKNKSQKVLSVFLKNFGLGCVGGNFKYLAKYQTFYLQKEENEFYAPINRAVFFLGHSIVLNASKNLKPFENLYYNYLGLNFTYMPKSQERKLAVQLSLGTAVSVLSFVSQGHRLNYFKSLEYGSIYFDPNSKSNSGESLALYNSMVISNQSLIPHEIVHTYQKYDFFTISSFYGKPVNKLINKKPLIGKISKFIAFDYQPIFNKILYKVQPEPLYYNNFFEYEAEHFSKRIPLNRN